MRRVPIVTPDRPEIDRAPQPVDAGSEPSPRRVAGIHRPGPDDLLAHDDLLGSMLALVFPPPPLSRVSVNRPFCICAANLLDCRIEINSVYCNQLLQIDIQ